MVIIIRIFFLSILTTMTIAQLDIEKVKQIIDDTTSGPVKSYCINNEIVTSTYLNGDAKKQLSTSRVTSTFIKDCFNSADIEIPTTFEQAIALAVDMNSGVYKTPLPAGIAKAYGVNKWQSATGLLSHPMCESYDAYFSTRNNMAKDAKFTKVKGELKLFIDRYNSLRNQYLTSIKNSDSKDVIEAKKNEALSFYSSLLTSMAYRESLSSADRQTDWLKAKKNLPSYVQSDYKKNPGVKYYVDDYQTNKDSKLNIGLYQFSPVAGGNVNACLKAWNKAFEGRSEKCVVSERSSSKTFALLSSTDQVFNAFCGAHKLIQSYSVQTNTVKSNRTHRENYLSKKKVLKKGSERCISPFSYTSNTYNHYGTLAFTHAQNTKNVLDDVIKLEELE